MNNISSHKDLERALENLSPEERLSLSAMWKFVARAEDAPRFDGASIESAWTAIRTGIRGMETVVRSGDRAPVRHLRRVLVNRISMAAAAAILIGATGLALWFQPIEHSAVPGEHLTIHLPDGSNVELNSGSRIRYGRRFARSRDVELEGEAYFNVEPGNAPFIVTTFNGTIRVVGTRFNVRSWEESIDPSTIVALESGKLLFTSSRDPSMNYEMTPGQLRKIGGRETGAAENDSSVVRMALAWRSGQMMFKDTLLGVAIEDIERHFGIEVLVPSTPLLEKKFTLNINPRDPETVIYALSSALGVNYRPTLDGFEIYAPPS